MPTPSLVSIAANVLFAISATAQDAQEPAKTTKATFLLTGLHCPPCSTTVRNFLARVNGIKSVNVDYGTQKANVEFDESVLPAQSLATAIANTPHMMGGGMRYAGWLALKVPAITDQASGQKVKDALSRIEGVKSVAIYPAQHATGVLFDAKGKLTSQQVVEILAKDGIEAGSY